MEMKSSVICFCRVSFFIFKDAVLFYSIHLSHIFDCSTESILIKILVITGNHRGKHTGACVVKLCFSYLCIASVGQNYVRTVCCWHAKALMGALFKLMSFSFSEHLPLCQASSRSSFAAGGRCDGRESTQWNGVSQVRKYLRKFSLSKTSSVVNNL